jgi:hypothetical protein
MNRFERYNAPQKLDKETTKNKEISLYFINSATNNHLEKYGFNHHVIDI